MSYALPLAPSSPLPLRLLLVDDEPLVRRALARVLRAAGFAVAEANGANAALDLLARERVDLVVSDVSMPDGDGLSLLDYVHRAHAGVKVVVLSGALDERDAIEAYARGASACFAKPVEGKRLVDAIRSALAA